MNCVKPLMIVALSLLLGACADHSARSMTLAMADTDARYQHLYASISHHGYEDESFDWVDKLPMPKRD
ncbi:hypothetical protein GC177_05240 [bacterium]|nr:hypothetical protein [bacterium]